MGQCLLPGWPSCSPHRTHGLTQCSKDEPLTDQGEGPMRHEPCLMEAEGRSQGQLLGRWTNTLHCASQGRGDEAGQGSTEQEPHVPWEPCPPLGPKRVLGLGQRGRLGCSASGRPVNAGHWGSRHMLPQPGQTERVFMLSLIRYRDHESSL